ncbi:MAG: plasmid stabilization protein [Oceanospirillaceae bacterium]|nr:plasmid stabilization protein [Oceanospirillaceae bacterium]
MAEVIWTEPALQQLEAIAEYVALDNPAVASHLVQTIFDKTERLSAFPQSGRIPPELPNSVYREVVVPPWVVFRNLCHFSSICETGMTHDRQIRFR